jgi:hypothetical protein
MRRGTRLQHNIQHTKPKGFIIRSPLLTTNKVFAPHAMAPVHQDKPRHSTDLVELRSPIPWSALYPFRTHHYAGRNISCHPGLESPWCALFLHAQRCRPALLSSVCVGLRQETFTCYVASCQAASSFK